MLLDKYRLIHISEAAAGIPEFVGILKFELVLFSVNICGTNYVKNFQ